MSRINLEVAYHSLPKKIEHKRAEKRVHNKRNRKTKKCKRKMWKWNEKKSEKNNAYTKP